MGYLVQKGFDGKPGVRVTNGTPPLHRNTNLRRMQIDLQIWDPVENVSSAFHGSDIHSVLYHHGFKRSSLRDRLPNNRVGPRDRFTVRVQACRKAVVPHRVIPATL